MVPIAKGEIKTPQARRYSQGSRPPHRDTPDTDPEREIEGRSWPDMVQFL